ncbi:hypothetical protein WH87_05720 [Devosia epidermidihirudinis]|uniref:DUF2934 domain-containing protein n=1 Tax=Devosia epidermidihirudinis TaxID=1293439 RepID=A0A0F5QFD6_9HYPH|nr:DUF2934 domain-containing protein [Devosia epidermidihirudinis]KKC39650.1 hypothetical protein WH87_05720 [Devosia epidermidihirudinis]
MHIYTEDDIRERAYRLWIDAGSPDGRDVEFWFMAEQQLADEDKFNEPEMSGRAAQGDNRTSPLPH